MSHKTKFLVTIGLTILLTHNAFLQPRSARNYKNYAPVVSPNGKTIAYYAKIKGNWDVYLIDVDGKNKKRLTTHSGFDGEPSWSPDGAKVAFSSDRSGSSQIYTVDIRSQKVEKVGTTKQPSEDPVFLPDGTGILYRSKVGSEWFPFIVDLKDGGQRIFSNIPTEGRMRLSTQGKSVSFVTRIRDRHAICRIDMNGNPISMTFTRFDLPGNPQFSDLHSRFVFDAHAGGSDNSGDGKWELWTIKVDGEGLKRITNDNFDDWGASWSSKSSFLVFAGGGLEGNGYEIFYLDLTSKRPRQLTFTKD